MSTFGFEIPDVTAAEVYLDFFFSEFRLVTSSVNNFCNIKFPNNKCTLYSVHILLHTFSINKKYAIEVAYCCECTDLFDEPRNCYIALFVRLSNNATIHMNE